jgi:cell division protein FtsB
MKMDWATILVSLVVAVGGAGGLVQLLSFRSTRRGLSAGTDKIKMEAADILAESAVTLLMPLKEELSRVSAKADSLAAKVEDLEATLSRERTTSEVRIRQLEFDIAARDRTLAVRDAEIKQLREHIKSAPGWPGA